MKKITALTAAAILCFVCAACQAPDTGQSEDSYVKTEEKSSYEEKNKSGYPDSVGEFSVTALDGTTLTQEYFSQADLTVINFWATYCGYCIDEMPELEAWAKEDKRIQVLGVLTDCGTETQAEFAHAKSIIESAGITYPNVLYKNAFEEFMINLYAVPTTILVDKDGNVVGGPIIGAQFDAYKEAAENYLNEL